jgi:energy-coupling factor transporter ATP-binding protein EcfA2
MQIFDHFSHLILTNDQQSALEKLEVFLAGNDRIFVLQGYAGSGKTTLLKGLANYLKARQQSFQLMAPTGRAAKVISQKTGMSATTVHKGIYSFTDLIEEGEGEEVDGIFVYHFKIANSEDAHRSIQIIDEASLLSDKASPAEFYRFGTDRNLHDLITYSRIQDINTTSKIIFVGDPAQLPPVGMATSPALDPEYLAAEYGVGVSVVQIKEVKRQEANNGILKAATRIRRCLTSGFFNNFDLRQNSVDIFNPTYAQFLTTYKSVKGQKVIICFKNKTAGDLNAMIRLDKFGADLPIQPSDTVIIGKNNYQLEIMNGEFAVVAEASPSTISRNIRFKKGGGSTVEIDLTWRQVTLTLPDENNQPRNVGGYILENFLYGDGSLLPEEHRALYIDFKNRHPRLRSGSPEFKEAIQNDPYLNCVMLKFGYAVTCHKAQGGEWPNTFVFWDKGAAVNADIYRTPPTRAGKTNPDFYRWAYTAVTRASNNLYCINSPYFSSFSGMVFTETQVKKAYDALTGESQLPTGIQLNDLATGVLEAHDATEFPVTIQDHIIQRWHFLKDNGISITACVVMKNELRYTFQQAEKTASVKYWIKKGDKVGPKFMNLPGSTNSPEFYKTVEEYLNATPDTVILREPTKEDNSVISHVFEDAVAEEYPYLRGLFDAIEPCLEEEEVITNVEHLDYKDRYTIQKNGGTSVFDFEYNGKGAFGRVLPLEKRCERPDIIQTVKAAVNTLKAADHVI